MKAWQAFSTSEFPEPRLSFLGGELVLVVGDIDNLVIGVIGKVDNLERVSLLLIRWLCLYFLTFIRAMPVQRRIASVEMTPNDPRTTELVLLDKSITDRCEVESAEIFWTWCTDTEGGLGRVERGVDQ